MKYSRSRLSINYPGIVEERGMRYKLECCEVLNGDDIVWRVICSQTTECLATEKVILMHQQTLSHSEELVHAEALINYLEQNPRLGISQLIESVLL